jgi:hypothetical protein
MTKDTAKEILMVYQKFRARFPVNLYFIVRSYEYTKITHGFGELMPSYLNKPLKLETMTSQLAFVLIIPTDSEKHRVTYYYDYRDLDVTENTEKFIRNILTPNKTTLQPQIFKFDGKNIYNFNKNNK